MQKFKTFSSRAFHAWQTLPDSSPQRWFVAAALFFGAIFAVISPAYDVPDEYSHLSRAYQIGHGQFLSTKQGADSGGYLPASFKKIGEAVRSPDFSLHKLAELGNIPLNADQQIYHGFPNLVIYSPIVYAPQAVGLDVGELLHLPAFYTLVLARLLNLAVYVLLFYWAIRLLPFAKWVGVIVGLLPMHILLAGSMSADPMSIGLAALTVASVLYLRDKSEPLAKTQYWLLLVLVACLSLTKLPFPLLAILFVFLPIRVLGGTRKNYWRMIGGCALTAIIVGGGWLFLAKNAMVSYGPPGVDPAAQIASLHSPTEFAHALINTYFTPTSDSFFQNYVISVGPVLAWLPIWASYAYSAFLAASLVRIRTASKAVFTPSQKLFAALLGLGAFTLISLLLYISWTPINWPIIDGLQPRYFTPFIILLIPIVAARATKQKIEDGALTTRWYRYVPVAFLTASIIAAFYYFYTIKVVVPF